MEMRLERDLLGEREVPANALWGIHTLRARENFALSARPVHRALIEAFGIVKLACLQTNRALGAWDSGEKYLAVEQACLELSRGKLNEHIVVDALQGGAGTSTNMNVNEVLANRALQILGFKLGSYFEISPLDDVNRHQSTNDTYPTALRVAAMNLLQDLEQELVCLQEAFQAKESEFSHIVKVARTELQDAVLTTLGRSMSAYAEAFGRDRWRVYKCNERLRVVNLGGTAIGSGIGAPREYIFKVVDNLRALSGLNLARAENLTEATQNTDVFVEVSGILKALASSLLKCSSDLRLLSSGPQAGLSELILPEKQAGSTMMPGKINPVIPEAISQSAITVISLDSSISYACGLGNLELNQFMPLIADCLLTSLSLLTASCKTLREHCITELQANEETCKAQVLSSTASATALVEILGYEATTRILKLATAQGTTIKQALVNESLLSEEDFDKLSSPESVCRLGSPPKKG